MTWIREHFPQDVLFSGVYFFSNHLSGTLNRVVESPEHTATIVPFA
jgi:hypothetical protein